MKTILIVLALLIAQHARGQSTILFQFESDDENVLIRENDSVKFYKPTSDSNTIVAINEDNLWYKLLSKEKKVLAEGAFVVEGEKYLQDGKWVQRHGNGKPQLMGCYLKGKPAGTWQEYYPTGTLKTVYNFAVITDEGGTIHSCLSGTWQEFYQNGQLKVNGLYNATLSPVNQKIVVFDPINNTEVKKTITSYVYKPVKCGNWENYTSTGQQNKPSGTPTEEE